MVFGTGKKKGREGVILDYQVVIDMVGRASLNLIMGNTGSESGGLGVGETSFLTGFLTMLKYFATL